MLSSDATGSLITGVGVRSVQTRDQLLKGVESQKLSNVFEKLFQKRDTIPGGTAGAIKNEVLTRTLTKGISHTGQRASDTMTALQKIIANPNTNK